MQAMTKEEIAKLFENAPEGATHWGPDNACYCECFYKKSASGWMFSAEHTEMKWRELSSGMDDERLNELVIYAPWPWNGEGLPPVGTVCEYNAMPLGKPKKWHVVEVVYSSDWFIVLRCISAPEGHSDSEGVEISIDVLSDYKEDIRPIRTTEQLAAEAREAAIEAMDALVDIDSVPTWRDALAALYDAGLRFPEGGAK